MSEDASPQMSELRRRLGWKHYALAAAGAIVFSLFGFVAALAVGFCEGSDCSDDFTWAWFFLATSLTCSIAAWLISGVVVRRRRLGKTPESGGPTLALLLASIPPLLPALSIAFVSFAEHRSVEENAISLGIACAASALIAGRLVWGMTRGYLKPNIAYIALVVIPAVLAVGLTQLAYLDWERQEEEFANYRPTEAQQRIDAVYGLQRFGDRLRDQQQDSAKHFDELLDLQDRRVLASIYQGKEAAPPYGDVDLRYARSDDESRAVMVATIGESEFVWSYEINRRGGLDLGAYCKGPPACGAEIVPEAGSFFSARIDPERCREIATRRTAWCAKSGPQQAEVVDELPVSVTELRSKAEPLPWREVGESRHDPEHPAGNADGKYAWLLSFDKTLGYRQSAEMWEQDRFADFHVDWRLDELVNEPTVIPLAAKLRYRIFKGQRRALLALDYKGSTFIWDFRSPSSEEWVVDTYCRGRRMCGEIVPAFDGFAQRSTRTPGCRKMSNAADEWCASSGDSARPHVGPLPADVKRRLAAAKKLSNRHRHHPSSSDENEPEPDPTLAMSWLSRLVEAISVMQSVVHTGGYHAYSDPRTQRMMKGMHAWDSVPDGVDVRGDATDDGESALVLITYGKSEFLVDYETEFGKMGVRVFCRGAPNCGLAVPDQVDFRIKAKRDRECRAIEKNSNLWCAYEYKKRKVVTGRLPKELRSRYRRLSRQD